MHVMGAVWMRARVDLRRQRWALVVAALVVALAGGLVLAAIAGTSRTRSALPRFIEYSRPETFEAFAPELPLAKQEEVGARLAALPAIEASTATAFVLFAAVDDDGEPILGAEGGIGATALVGPDTGRDMSRPLLVDGRLPSSDRADEVAIDEDFADYWGVGCRRPLRGGRLRPRSARGHRERPAASNRRALGSPPASPV